MTTFEELRSLAEISDPVTRARRLGDALTEVAELSRFLSTERRGALAEMRAKPMTFGEIALRLRMTPARVGQILAKGRRPAHADPAPGGATSRKSHGQ
jgi:hypothetical protein